MVKIESQVTKRRYFFCKLFVTTFINLKWCLPLLWIVKLAGLAVIVDGEMRSKLNIANIDLNISGVIAWFPTL